MKDRRDADRDEREPRMGEPGWFPDHVEEWREDFRRTTPEERVLAAIRLSRFQTRVAAAGRDS